jgi:putative inorganic carbon (hco3(-)) transporter
MKISRYFLFAYILLLPFQVEISSTMRLAPSDGALFLYVLCGGCLTFSGRAWGFWHWAIPAVFALGLLVSQIKTGNVSSYATIQKFGGICVLLVAYAALVSHANCWADVRRTINLFVSVVVIQNIIAIVLFYLWSYHRLALPGIDVGLELRLTGLLRDPNAYGGLLVTAFALLVTGDFNETMFQKWIWRIGIPSLLLGLLLTYSRSSWIGLSLVLMGVGATRPGEMLKIASFIILAASVALSALPDEYLNTILRMSARPDQISVRREIINLAFQLYSENPIVGIGLGCFTRHHPQIVHNTTIWFLTELGIVGLIAFAGFCLTFVAWAWDAFKKAPSNEKNVVLGMLLAIFAMYGVSMGIEAFYQRHCWFILAMLGGCHAFICAPIRPHFKKQNAAALETAPA